MHDQLIRDGHGFAVHFLRAIFDGSPGSPYYFWRGFNPAALVALATGCAAYILLLNPLTYASWGPYRFLTASLPSALVAGLVHALGTRLVRRAGRGGYGRT